MPRGSATEFVARVVEAERRGVPRVWTTVGGPTADPVTAYAAAGAATKRIGLGTAVVPTYPRHPITLAAQAVAIDDLAPGRLRLGVGPSHRPTIEGAYGLPMGKPLAHLREYVTILRALLWEGSVDFAGDYFTVKMPLSAGVPTRNIPIPISALRTNAFRLAGEIADGAISWVTPIDYLTQTALPALQAGADAAGRARPPLIAHVPVMVAIDRAAARAAFRAQFPGYAKLPFYAAMFAAAGYPVTPAGEMTDELVETLAVSGSPDEIRERLEAIRARGLDELMISLVVVADEEAELAALSDILAGA
ncbi:MAG TPA: LLM class flavin-dependent oxidoreductase [Thermomicrobiales bacterium]|nr:LLM class flavin-dependent oxidoreductase [Thermomicrobiales bacterium]